MAKINWIARDEALKAPSKTADLDVGDDEWQVPAVKFHSRWTSQSGVLHSTAPVTGGYV